MGGAHHCSGRAPVSEMTYTVSSGTLNSTIPSLLNPVMRQKTAIISSCLVLPPEMVMHDNAYIGVHSENNIICVMHDNLWRKNQTTLYILSRHWLYEWFSQFHSCGTYSVLSWSPSIILIMTKMLERCKHQNEDIWSVVVDDSICTKASQCAPG